MAARYILLLFIGCLTLGCSDKNSKKTIPENTTNWDSVFTTQGLQNIQKSDSTILVDLRYSSQNNFIGKDLYGSLEQAYLRPLALNKLLQASEYLRKKNPDLRLYIYDAARPRRIQKILWEKSGLPEQEKAKYVANPQSGSIHNYGFAVDLTLSDSTGKELDMGTDYDHFTEKAHIDKEENLVNKGILTMQQVENRRILRNAMTQSGFIVLNSEWWHFDALPRDEVTSNYIIIE
ncbi:MAG: M15 family metallopeptidase [Gracilimonas sp.]|nr:M15 family metallopeptidase [Gracilimonas sp.]